MTREEFGRQIHRLGAAFRFPREETIQVYYDELGEASERDLAEAVTRLIHGAEHFPTVREIEEELEDVRRERRARAPDPVDLAPCLDCNGTGFVLEERFTDDGPSRVAKFCECAKGQRYKAAREAREKGIRYGQGRRKP